MSKKILFIFGTRPEAIKLAPIIREMKKQPDVFDFRVCVTAQHREMLDQVLDIFDIKPDHDLNLMRPDQTLFDVTADAIRGLEGVLKKEKPDVVLVQGDTTTVFSAALAAYYLRISVGHVEAGLRTNNKYSPFPEEINRRLTTTIADHHFAPTNTSRNNLIHDGISKDKIYVTGNTVIDALFWALDMLKEKSFNDFSELQGLETSGRVILVTGHRRENFGRGFQNICRSLKHIAEQNKDVCIIYPVHLNPNVCNPVFDILGDVVNIKLIKPLSYLPFVFLMSRAYMVLTDSGGVQEEAPSLGKPVLVMRDTTERPEAVEAGTVKLVGTNFNKIVNEAQKLLDDRTAYANMSNAVNPYGDGHAARRIAAVLAKQPWHPFNPKS